MASTLSQREYDQISAGFDTDPRKSSSINTCTYTEPKFLDIERDQVFRDSWQFVCHEEKLREAGSYVVTEVQGASILLVRGEEGDLRAFYNVCKHRGHELLHGEGTTRLINCPYHAWSYQLDGRLRAARRSEHLINFDKDKICLDQVQIEVFCHLVFVNLNSQAAPLSEQSGDLAGEIMSSAPDLASLTYAKSLHLSLIHI